MLTPVRPALNKTQLLQSGGWGVPSPPQVSAQPRGRAPGPRPPGEGPTSSAHGGLEEKTVCRGRPRGPGRGMAAAAAAAGPGAAAEAAAGPGEEAAAGPGPGVARLARLPLSRVKALMKADPDVSQASQEAVFVLARAAELFVETLAKDAYVYAQQSKRKTLQRKDLDNAIEAIDEFAFLEGTLD
ncbi:DNA polymerase epsilon subunit 4 [Opisthocomus hoazin]|uniref:DNA polymerase epsilon subunit 4 n=1 Tax=Opisthocomus hoazin TaxID=30419 RepID=UPI003F535FE0